VVPAQRILVAAVGTLTALALAGCGPYGEQKPASAVKSASTQAPVAQPSAANPAPAQVTLTGELTATTLPQMGQVITDGEGWVYYRFDKDTANPSKSNCENTCAQVWPAALTDGHPVLHGISPEKVGTVTRADGSMQITVGGWPIYRYTGDLKPGQWKGQGVGGTWFVVAPDGKKNLTCLPTGTPTPVAPPTSSPASADY